MRTFWESKNRPNPLSVEVVLAILFAHVAALGSLTSVTHLAQLLSLPFRTFSYLVAGIGSIAAAAAIAGSIGAARRSAHKDYFETATVLAVGLLGALLAVSFHRVGRISPDEYYYAANPVFYIQHPDSKMGFESRLFYANEAVQSASMLTAGAYEYVEGAVAFLADIPFRNVYYLLGGGLTGFLIPLSLFLLVYCFSGSVAGSSLGAFATVCGLTLMGETSWSPGANSFLRAFEGKSLLLFAGMPLLAAFSLMYFVKQTPISWLRLFALCVALAGVSTTSLAVAPILGLLMCASYWLGSGQWVTPNRRFVLHLMVYCAAFIYVGAWGILVAYLDGAQKALFFNSDYPSTFVGYLGGYVYPGFPLTPVLAVLACAAALVFARGRSRRILLWWNALVVLLVLNPLAAEFWLQYLRGIYARLFYLLPFPTSIGFLGASLHAWASGRAPSYRNAVVIATCGALALLPIAVPVSVFRLPLYARGSPLQDSENRRAAEIVAAVPNGVMLAPWPISGAVSMLDSEKLQMLTRPDILQFYLGLQGRDADSALRLRVQAVLDGNGDDSGAMAQLLDNYPEIRSVVMERQAYLQSQDALDRLLGERGYSRQKVFIPGLAVFSR